MSALHYLFCGGFLLAAAVIYILLRKRKVEMSDTEAFEKGRAAAKRLLEARVDTSAEDAEEYHRKTPRLFFFDEEAGNYRLMSEDGAKAVLELLDLPDVGELRVDEPYQSSRMVHFKIRRKDLSQSEIDKLPRE